LDLNFSEVIKTPKVKKILLGLVNLGKPSWGYHLRDSNDKIKELNEIRSLIRDNIKEKFDKLIQGEYIGD
jgi:hypothetical protein